MIKLCQFRAPRFFPNLSPYCVKIESFLKLHHIPYEIEIIPGAHRAPRGKLPFIKDDERVISDSTVIIEYLKDKYKLNIDPHLGDKEKAESKALQRLIEEHLFYIHAYFRWIDHDSYKEFKKAVFGKMPFIMRDIVPTIMRRRLLKRFKSHALSDHSKAEILSKAQEDITALAHFLGDKKYFFSENQISFIDIICFSFVGNILNDVFASPIKEIALKHPNLKNHSDHMLQLFKSDFPYS